MHHLRALGDVKGYEASGRDNEEIGVGVRRNDAFTRRRVWARWHDESAGDESVCVMIYPRAYSLVCASIDARGVRGRWYRWCSPL